MKYYLLCNHLSVCLFTLIIFSIQLSKKKVKFIISELIILTINKFLIKMSLKIELLFLG